MTSNILVQHFDFFYLSRFYICESQRNFTLPIQEHTHYVGYVTGYQNPVFLIRLPLLGHHSMLELLLY